MKALFCVSILAVSLTWTAHAQFGQTVQYFPQFAVGGPAESYFSVDDPGDHPISVTLQLFLSDGSLFAVRQVQVPSGGTVTEIFADPEGQLTSGWAKLSSADKFTSSLFFRIPGVGNVGLAPSVEATRLKVFNFSEGGIRTGFAVANPSETEPSEVTYRVVGVDGNEFVSGEFTLEPGRHLAFFFDEAPTLAGSDGSIDLEASSPVIAVALRLQDSLLASVPVVLPNLVRVEFNDESPNVILGHDGNFVAQGVKGGTVGGGGGNGALTDSTGFSIDCPDCLNRVTDSYGTVGGGGDNEAAYFATVAGGRSNTADDSHATVGGGFDNTADGLVSTVGGGFTNMAGEAGTVAGGFRNTAGGVQGAVGGGLLNETGGVSATVAGGARNTAQNGAAVGGGELNTAGGDYSTIPGGFNNRANGNYSFAAGRRAVAAGAGSFVWADSTDDDFGPASKDSFLVRASGGARIYSSSNLSSGVRLEPGSSSWSMVSDRANKENLEEVQGGTVLERLAALPISTWNYKSQAQEVRHMGPMAQDFHAAFGLGENERRISSVDADGVALAAIQGLYRLLEEKDAEIESLRREVAEIRALIEAR